MEIDSRGVRGRWLTRTDWSQVHVEGERLWAADQIGDSTTIVTIRPVQNPGEETVVTKRGRPVAKIVPVQARPIKSVEEQQRIIEEFRRIHTRRSGRKNAKSRKRFRANHRLFERAAALLRNTDRSVAEICFSVGRASVGSFTTSFTRTYGVDFFDPPEERP